MSEYNISKIYENDKRSLKLIDDLLAKEEIRRDKNLDYTCAMFDDDMNIIATGSCFKNTLRCLAVDNSHQGEGLMNQIVTHLVDYEFSRGLNHLFLYTKNKSMKFFKDLAFYEIINIENQIVFMENKRTGFSDYLDNLKKDMREGKEIASLMRQGRTRRRPAVYSRQVRPRFKDPMVMISQRPASVEDRAVPGHWEGDLIIGAKGRSAVGTLVERSTRYTLLLYLPNGHSAAEVQDAVIAKLAGLPDSLRLSLTWDQGSELAQHRKIASRLGLEVYFCDPHSPWQRGTNENTNGLLRQYLPKGTDLSVWSEGELDVIAGELNDRPRKTLDWDTPRERFGVLLAA